ncbi:MAG: aminomethyl-transferring glycine dehydrogenase subunit GcvPB [Bacillota bacterium]|nr:aminomethyl-transferring glycine dehydrogenase subunit GcvPB [Bacillota bacterium]
MELIFEKSVAGKKLALLPDCDVPEVEFDAALCRSSKPELPEVSETEISRHYSKLAHRAYGVNDGFYPLGSCTMKYNPKVNEDAAALEGLTDIHPLQPVSSMQGWLELYDTAEMYLKEITGMDAVCFQPAAGAHGEFTGIQLIKAYHVANNDIKRNKIIVPDSAHGTNPASGSMCGYEVVSVPSNEDGGIDLEQLAAAVGDDTAGLMLTNPNTLGIFDKNILKITEIIHDAGGLCYYDGANLNAVMGIVRPGDMGFDVMHMNLHKTFSTPHGGGGPGSGPVACKDFLAGFLPGMRIDKKADGTYDMTAAENTIGSVGEFYGNALVVAKALTYLLTLGREGVPEAARNAVLNANYMKAKLEKEYDIPYDKGCLHEFVISAVELKKETGVSAMDVAKSLIDYGIHPPTIYFPLIVHEALMFEPTETETKETIDNAVSVLLKIKEDAYSDPEKLHGAPHNAAIKRPDEVKAARHPIVRYDFEKEE